MKLSIIEYFKLDFKYCVCAFKEGDTDHEITTKYVHWYNFFGGSAHNRLIPIIDGAGNNEAKIERETFNKIFSEKSL